MRRIIREDEPPRPSHKLSTLANEQVSTISQSRKTDARELSLSMQQEVDWIVMRALEKDRTRRYESASALAEDIQRYLDDEPVQACPPSVGYRLHKYAKRHKGLLTTITLIAGDAAAGDGRQSVVCGTSRSGPRRRRHRAAEVRTESRSGPRCDRQTVAARVQSRTGGDSTGAANSEEDPGRRSGLLRDIQHHDG